MTAPRTFFQIPPLKLDEIKKEKKHPDSPHPKKRNPREKTLKSPKECFPIEEGDNTPRPKGVR